MRLDILKESTSNNRMSKSRIFHNVWAAHMNDYPKNTLLQTLLNGGTRNQQGSNETRVRTVVLISFMLIKSHKYSVAVVLTALCVKSII